MLIKLHSRKLKMFCLGKSVCNKLLTYIILIYSINNYSNLLVSDNIYSDNNNYKLGSVEPIISPLFSVTDYSVITKKSHEIIDMKITFLKPVTALVNGQRVYTIHEKLENKPTIPVFNPWWPGWEEGIICPPFFECDDDGKPYPYSLIWTGSGIVSNIDSTRIDVSPMQTNHMRSDKNTLYLINEEWNYWNLSWRTLSVSSKFYLDEIFEEHVNSEYGDTKVINFEHPDWPDLLADKAYNFKQAGFDGILLDWWNNYAGNGRPQQDVELARLAIMKTIRNRVGTDFILMGNVNWEVNDPTTQYLSGAFLELWKPYPGKGYAITYSEEDNSVWNLSIERMEELLKYWNENLQWPKIIAFEAWKITTSDYIADRRTEENYNYAKLFTSMALVIAENAYVLYADNNDDFDGEDHQHAYYDFYLSDFGKATSGMIEVSEGVAYKQYERGLIAYNRTMTKVQILLSDGKRIDILPIEGLLIEKY